MKGYRRMEKKEVRDLKVIQEEEKGIYVKTYTITFS